LARSFTVQFSKIKTRHQPGCATQHLPRVGTITRRRLLCQELILGGKGFFVSSFRPPQRRGDCLLESTGVCQQKKRNESVNLWTYGGVSRSWQMPKSLSLRRL
jgi:hypothetical protein